MYSTKLLHSTFGEICTSASRGQHNAGRALDGVDPKFPVSKELKREVFSIKRQGSRFVASENEI